MAIGTPSFRNRPGRSTTRTIPDSRPPTNVPRPRTFPANTNRPPSPVPKRGQGRLPLSPRQLRSAAISALSAYLRPGGPPTGDQYYSITDLGNGYDNIRPYGRSIGDSTSHNATLDLHPGGTAWAYGANRKRTTVSNWWVYTTATFNAGLNRWIVADPYLWPGNTAAPPSTSPQLVPVPRPAVAPAALPRYRPREEPVPLARAAPLIRPGVGFDVFPGAPPRPVEVKPTKPPRGTREVKATGAAARAVAIVNAAFNSATEVADVLAIFWEHVADVTPGRDRTFWDTMTQMAENPDLWAQVDWEQVVADMVANEIEDQIVGRLHGAKRKLQTEWGSPTYGSVFTGP